MRLVLIFLAITIADSGLAMESEIRAAERAAEQAEGSGNKAEQQEKSREAEEAVKGLMDSPCGGAATCGM